ncbi:hypothetical protein [Streptomyces sp. NBC_00829]|uniref:hypothetical protein n=1 Tax=Streptomyces sp. NBC_00829 TaxID=2903679 RepID=UPI00386FAA96|nr:hypothetical protein OG293_27965 [Streptomyces sp. NBC_00829]
MLNRSVRTRSSTPTLTGRNAMRTLRRRRPAASAVLTARDIRPLSTATAAPHDA